MSPTEHPTHTYQVKGVLAVNAAGLEGLGKKSASTVEVSSPSAMTKGSRDIETFRGGQNGKGEFAFRLHPPPPSLFGLQGKGSYRPPRLIGAFACIPLGFIYPSLIHYRVMAKTPFQYAVASAFPGEADASVQCRPRPLSLPPQATDGN